MKNWLNSRRKIDLGRRKQLLRCWRKSVTITVVCHTAYLSWAFLVVCCLHWLGSFAGCNYLGRSVGFIFVCSIFRGLYFSWASSPHENWIHWKFNPWKFVSRKISTSMVCDKLVCVFVWVVVGWPIANSGRWRLHVCTSNYATCIFTWDSFTTSFYCQGTTVASTNTLWKIF